MVKSLTQKLRLSTFAPFLPGLLLAKLVKSVSNNTKTHALLAKHSRIYRIGFIKDPASILPLR
jgi:hypothetical protein